MALQDAGLARNVEVFNLPGAGGTVGLRRIVHEKATEDLVMVMGLGLLGAVYTHKSTATLDDTTPLARLMEEPGGIFVSKDSPHATLDDLITAWRADPRTISVGGGSFPGGPDHLLAIALAEAVGIDPKAVRYVSSDGGGELLPKLLGREVTFGTSGYSEYLDQVRAGSLRMLAVTSERRVPVLPDVPTATEQGVALAFANWRAIVAPPGIEPEDKQRLVGLLDRMHTSDQWRGELASRGWTDAYLDGDRFADFLREQDRRVADVLTKLGPV